MIRVLIFRETPENINEGVDKHCRALYELLLNNSQVEILPIENVKDVIYIKFLKNRQLFKLSSLKKRIRESNCDIVHVHGFASFLAVEAIIAAKLCGKKILYTAHYHPINTLDNPRFGKLFFNFLLRPVLHFVDGFISLNDEDKAFFGKYIKTVFQIPHWMRMEPKSVDVSMKKKNMILFVGRNKLNKGVEHLFQIPRNKYEVHCVCGETIINRDDFILHHDISNEELSSLYAQASLLVVPSKYEAFSLVALEAFMHKTPVLMSDRVRIADYLNGCNGYKVFKYGDMQSFLELIDETMKVNVDVERILEIFNPNRIKDLYLNAYNRIMQ